MARRVVIVGMGAVSPLGNTVDTMWRAAKDGVCGIAPIGAYDPSEMKVRVAGEVRDLDVNEFIDKREARKQDRFTQFALIASQEAFAMSGLDMSYEDAGRCGCLISSGIGGLDVIAQEQMKGVAHGFDRVSPHFIPMVITNMAAGSVAIQLGLKVLVPVWSPHVRAVPMRWVRVSARCVMGMPRSWWLVAPRRASPRSLWVVSPP